MKINRKIIIAAAAVILVIGAVIAAILIFGKGEYVETNDTDAQYPYTIRKDNVGITVKVNGKFPKEAFFHANGLTGATEVSEKKSTSRKAVFKIKPISAGTDTISLFLEKEGTFTERLYVITLYLLVDDSNQITVTGSDSISLGSAISKTDGDGICYVITSPGAGLCEINLMKRDANDSFVLKTDDSELFRIVSQDSDETVQTFRLSAKAAGEVNVAFLCDNQKSALDMKITVNEKLQFAVEDIKESAYDAKNEKLEKQKKEAEAIVGAILLPNNASVQGYNTLMLNGEKSIQAADATYIDGDKTFSLFISQAADITDYVSFFHPSEAPKAVNAAGLLASECYVEDGYMLFWKSASAKICALFAPAREDALSQIERVLEADPSLR